MRNFFPEEANAVDDISELKNLEPVPTRAVVVESFQLSTEGLGGGIFWWDDNGDASLADNDTTISSNVDGFGDGEVDEGVWRRVSYTDSDSSTFTSGQNININYNSSVDSYDISLVASGSDGDFQINDGNSLGTATGTEARFDGDNESFTFGYRTGSVGDRSIVLNGNPSFNNMASGNLSFAAGRGTTANGFVASSFGSETTASGSGSQARGSLTDALALISEATGRSTLVRNYASLAVGIYNEDYRTGTTANISQVNDFDRVFSVGVGDRPSADLGDITYNDGRGRVDGLYVTYRNGTVVRHALQLDSYNNSTGQYETTFKVDKTGSIVEGGAVGGNGEIQFNDNGSFSSDSDYLYSTDFRTVLNSSKTTVDASSNRFYDPSGSEDFYSSFGTAVVSGNNSTLPFTEVQAINENDDVFTTLNLFAPNRSGSQPILSVSSSEQSESVLTAFEDNSVEFNGTLSFNSLVQNTSISQILIRNPSTNEIEYVDGQEVFKNQLTVEGGDNVETTFNASVGTYIVDVPFTVSKDITYVGRDLNGDLTDFDDSVKNSLQTSFDQFTSNIEQYDLTWGDISTTSESGLDLRDYQNTSTNASDFAIGLGRNITFEGTDSFGSSIYAFDSAGIGKDVSIQGAENTFAIGTTLNAKEALSTFVIGKDTTVDSRDNISIGFSNEIGSDPGRRSFAIGWGVDMGVSQARNSTDPQIAMGFFNEEFSSERVTFNYGSGTSDTDRFTPFFIERDSSSNHSFLHGSNVHLNLSSLFVNKGFQDAEGSIIGRKAEQTFSTSSPSDVILWGDSSFDSSLNLDDSILFDVNSSRSESTSNSLETTNTFLQSVSVSGISDTFQPTFFDSIVIDSEFNNTDFSDYGVTSTQDRIEAFIYNNKTIVGYSGGLDRDGSVILAGGTVGDVSGSIAMNGGAVSADNSISIGGITVTSSNILGIGDTVRITEPAQSTDSSQILVRNSSSGHVEYVTDDFIQTDVTGGLNVRVDYNASTNTFDVNVPESSFSNDSTTTDVVTYDPSNDKFHSATVYANDVTSVKVGSALQFDSGSITVGVRDRSNGTGVKTVSIGALVLDQNSDFNANRVTGTGTVAIGTSNDIFGPGSPSFSYALGLNNTVSSDYSIAIGGKDGNGNVIDSTDSFVFGQGNEISSSEPKNIHIGFDHLANSTDDKQHVLVGKNLEPGSDTGTQYHVSVGKYNEAVDQAVFGVGVGSSGSRKTALYSTENNGTFFRGGLELERLDGGSYVRTLRFNSTIQQSGDVSDSQFLVRNQNTGEVEYNTIGQIEAEGIEIKGKDDITVNFSDSLGQYEVSLVDNPSVESLVYNSGGLNFEEDNRKVEYSLNQITYDETQDKLEIDSQGSSKLPTLDDYSSWHFEGRVVARVDFATNSITDSSNGDSHMWKIEGAVTSSENESTGQPEPRFIGNPSITTISTDNTVFDYEVDLDVNDSGEFIIYIQGEEGATVNWTSSLSVVEVIA